MLLPALYVYSENSSISRASNQSHSNLTEKERPGPETVSAASVNLHSLAFFCTAELSSVQGQPINMRKGKQTPSLSHA